MTDDRIELRAERLRVLVAAIGEAPTIVFALGLEPDDIELDVDLARQCVKLERALRERQWDALEVADAVVAAGKGGSLPIQQQGRLARAILELGWSSTPDEG